MAMVVNCSGCRSPLQVPSGATAISCSICNALTQVATDVPHLPYSTPTNMTPSYQPPMPLASPYHQVPQSAPSAYDKGPSGASPYQGAPPVASPYGHTVASPYGHAVASPYMGAPPVASPYGHTMVSPYHGTPTFPPPYDRAAPPVASSNDHTLPPIASPYDHAVASPYERVALPVSASYVQAQPPVPYPNIQGLTLNQSPQYQAQPSPLPSVHGSKRAVICGVNYKGTEAELNGCSNDAKTIQQLLINHYKFPESSILMLTELESDPLKIPTKANIRSAIRWLLQGCQAGDSLVFHFSGHGSQRLNKNGEELDGIDETICPLDYEDEGQIVDEEINATLVKPVPQGVKLHALFDSCHSGTIMDLPYLCRMDRRGDYEWEDHRPAAGTWKGTSGGEVFCFTGCDDHQTSTDAPDLSRLWTGAMTHAFVQSINRGHGTTYGSLLSAMRSTIGDYNREQAEARAEAEAEAQAQREAEAEVEGEGEVEVQPLPVQVEGQIPQLCSNEKFDIYKTNFSM